MKRRFVLVAAAVVVVGWLVAPARAGMLLTTGTAYDNGTEWRGSTPFVAEFEETLHGRVEWVVYAPGQFPSGFTGYTPTTGEYTYVYQVFENGSSYVSSYRVPVVNPAGNIGYFNGGIGGNQYPYEAVLSVPGTAAWGFLGIPAGESSWALAFSSPNAPEFTYSIVVNSGATAVAEPIATPSPDLIPEPATVSLVIVVAGALLVTWFGRRRSAHAG